MTDVCGRWSGNDRGGCSAASANTPWEQSSPIQPGKHWQEPSMGLQVPLLVQRQISEQARPKRPLAHTAQRERADNKQTIKGSTMRRRRRRGEGC